MPSPFPGMDPYLEDPTLWPGVPQSLITYIRDELQPLLRPKYHAQIGERVYLLAPPRTRYPDITIIEHPIREPAPAGIVPAGTTTPIQADAPFKLKYFDDEVREPYIEIIHNVRGEVVTVIEILSPANKTAGEGLDLYKRKKREILNSQAHLVEIDLLKRGQHTVAAPLAELQKLPPYRYLVNVNRHPYRTECDAYTFTLMDRLPRVSIPLLPEDPDVVLDLPAVFARCYENGGYAEFVDYNRPPETDLNDEEQAWLAGLLADRPESPSPS